MANPNPVNLEYGFSLNVFGLLSMVYTLCKLFIVLCCVIANMFVTALTVCLAAGKQYEFAKFNSLTFSPLLFSSID